MSGCYAHFGSSANKSLPSFLTQEEIILCNFKELFRPSAIAVDNIEIYLFIKEGFAKFSDNRPSCLVTRPLLFCKIEKPFWNTKYNFTVNLQSTDISTDFQVIEC